MAITVSSSKRSAPTYRFEFRASRTLRRALSLGHGLCLLLILFYPMPLPLRIGALLLLAGLYGWHRVMLRAPALPVLLRRQGQWWEPGATAPLRVLGQWHGSRLALLRLARPSGERIGLRVLPDMLPDDDWRRLARILRDKE